MLLFGSYSDIFFRFCSWVGLLLELLYIILVRSYGLHRVKHTMSHDSSYPASAHEMTAGPNQKPIDHDAMAKVKDGAMFFDTQGDGKSPLGRSQMKSQCASPSDVSLKDLSSAPVESHKSKTMRKPPAIIGIDTGSVIPFGEELDREIYRMRRVLSEQLVEDERCRLLKKARESWQVGRELEAVRVATRDRLTWCNIQGNEFEKKEKELREVVVRNHQFLADTDVKIARAEKKAQDERNACKKADDEIGSLIDEMRQLKDDKIGEIDEIRKHGAAGKFLKDAATMYRAQKNSGWKTKLLGKTKSQTVNATLTEGGNTGMQRQRSSWAQTLSAMGSGLDGHSSALNSRSGRMGGNSLKNTFITETS